MKRTSTRMPFAVFEGGIVRLSRCLRESLIPHFIRDCPAGILRKRLVVSAAASRLNLAAKLAYAATSRCTACCRTQGGVRPHTRSTK